MHVPPWKPRTTRTTPSNAQPDASRRECCTSPVGTRTSAVSTVRPPSLRTNSTGGAGFTIPASMFQLAKQTVGWGKQPSKAPAAGSAVGKRPYASNIAPSLVQSNLPPYKEAYHGGEHPTRYFMSLCVLGRLRKLATRPSQVPLVPPSTRPSPWRPQRRAPKSRAASSRCVDATSLRCLCVHSAADGWALLRRTIPLVRTDAASDSPARRSLNGPSVCSTSARWKSHPLSPAADSFSRIRKPTCDRPTVLPSRRHPTSSPVCNPCSTNCSSIWGRRSMPSKTWYVRALAVHAWHLVPHLIIDF
jgi:hypothetical protein